jgi:hypothetical protein
VLLSAGEDIGNAFGNGAVYQIRPHVPPRQIVPIDELRRPTATRVIAELDLSQASLFAVSRTLPAMTRDTLLLYISLVWWALMAAAFGFLLFAH